MAKIKKAQLGGLIKKGVKKAVEETAPKSFKIENSMVKDVIKKKEREALKEKMRGWDKEMSKQKTGGTTMKKAKSGAKFDLNKDGKTTFKDVLIGRGVLPKTAKKGASVKKAQTGASVTKFKSDKEAASAGFKKNASGVYSKSKPKATMKSG